MDDLKYIVFESSGGKYRVEVLKAVEATVTETAEVEEVKAGPNEEVVAYIPGKCERIMEIKLLIGSVEFIGSIDPKGRLLSDDTNTQ